MTSVKMTEEMFLVYRAIHIAIMNLGEVARTFEADQHYAGLSDAAQTDIHRRTRITVERLRVLRTLVCRADERIDRC